MTLRDRDGLNPLHVAGEAGASVLGCAWGCSCKRIPRSSLSASLGPVTRATCKSQGFWHNKAPLPPLYAVIYKQDAVVEALLAAGADPHARGPNCYPSFSRWKMNRGMQAIQVGVGARAWVGRAASALAPIGELA